MRALLHKAIVLAGIAYVVSLPLSFFVGGVLYSRPLRTPVGFDDLREHMQDGWDASFLSDSREVKIVVATNVRLSATVFGGDSQSSVIVMHELGRNRLAALDIAYALWRAGVDVVLVDRRAHGNSDGEARPLFANEEKDIRAIVDQLLKNNWCGTGTIGLYGVGDAGTSCLIAAAEDSRIDAVCAENPVLSASEFIADSLSAWSGLPHPIVAVQAFLTSYGVALMGGVKAGDLLAKTRVAGLTTATLLLQSGGSGATEHVASIANGLGAPAAQARRIGGDLSVVTSFFHDHL